jgi:hypothetical protein
MSVQSSAYVNVNVEDTFDQITVRRNLLKRKGLKPPEDAESPSRSLSKTRVQS